MSSRSERRGRFLVDTAVQYALVRQIVNYWVGVTATFGLVVLVYRVFPIWLSGRGPGLSLLWEALSPLVLASLALFPVIVLSSIRFSNRFVGPMVRFRRVLRELADGGSPNTITLRKGDYWEDVADDINRILARFSQDAEQKATVPDQGPSEFAEPPAARQDLPSTDDSEGAVSEHEACLARS